MKRLALRAPRGIAFTLLLAYVLLAGGSSFLHTCRPLDELDQGPGKQQGRAAQPAEPATSLPSLDKAPATAHHGDCLACLWGSSDKQPHATSDSASVSAPSVPHIFLTQLPYYAPCATDPSGIRGPPQV